MTFAPLLLIIIGSIFEIIDGFTVFVIEVFFKEYALPNYLNILILAIQVSLFFLAIFLSTINLFRNKSNRMVHFCIAIMSMTLFIARLSWLINAINWTYFS